MIKLVLCTSSLYAITHCSILIGLSQLSDDSNICLGMLRHFMETVVSPTCISQS